MKAFLLLIVLLIGGLAVETEPATARTWGSGVEVVQEGTLLGRQTWLQDDGDAGFRPHVF